MKIESACRDAAATRFTASTISARSSG